MKMLSLLGSQLSLTLALTLSGCGTSPNNAGPAATPPVTASDEVGHSHDGWWCNEHGVPEEVCAQCSTKLAAEFKAQGDWCDEHDVPESQCFVCHPEEEQKFAAQYEAKYGKQPPARDDSAHSHEEHGHDS